MYIFLTTSTFLSVSVRFSVCVCVLLCVCTCGGKVSGLMVNLLWSRLWDCVYGSWAGRRVMFLIKLFIPCWTIPLSRKTSMTNRRPVQAREYIRHENWDQLLLPLYDSPDEASAPTHCNCLFCNSFASELSLLFSYNCYFR